MQKQLQLFSSFIYLRAVLEMYEEEIVRGEIGDDSTSTFASSAAVRVNGFFNFWSYVTDGASS